LRVTQSAEPGNDDHLGLLRASNNTAALAKLGRARLCRACPERLGRSLALPETGSEGFCETLSAVAMGEEAS
jgi:hypothetical protein